MLIIAGIKLQEHGIWAGGEVTLHNLGYLCNFGHDVSVHGSALKIDTNIRAGAQTEHLRIYMVARAGYHFHVDKTLKALMYGGSRHTTVHGHILRGDAGVMHYYLENFLVEVINLFHFFGLALAYGLLPFIVQN